MSVMDVLRSRLLGLHGDRRQQAKTVLHDSSVTARRHRDQ